MTFALFAAFTLLLQGVSPVAIDLNVDRQTALKDAERALKLKPLSVMDKKITPDSGDKHDYMSLGPYW